MSSSKKILFVTEYDPRQPGLRSGVPFAIYNALRKTNGISVEYLLVKDNRNLFQRLVSRYWQWRAGRTGQFYDAGFSWAMANSFKKDFKKLNLQQFNAILTISPKTVASLPVGLPIVIWIDNSLESFALYPGMENLSGISRKQGILTEKIAFSKSRLIYTASTYLKNALEMKYPDFSKKVRFMPRGANLSKWPVRQITNTAIANKIQNQNLEILHIVSGWWNTDRKGTSLVLEVYRILRKILPVRLTILGMVPAPIVAELESEGIIYSGNLNKQVKADWELYCSMMYRSHFLFVPSKADGFGIVYAEAAAFGLPSLALAVMGVTTAVQDGTTGLLLPVETDAATWAGLITKTWNDKEAYKSLCTTAANWAAEHFRWEKNVASIIDAVVQETEGSALTTN